MFQGSIRSLKKGDQKAVEEIFGQYWSADEEFLKKLCERLQSAIDSSPDALTSGLTYYVAENIGEIVGVVGFRKAPPHMQKFTQTPNLAELYILAVKRRGGGVGTALIEKALAEITAQNYSEVVLYSGGTHKESWGFYDRIGFERVSSTVAPNGEPGMVWKMLLMETEAPQI